MEYRTLEEKHYKDSESIEWINSHRKGSFMFTAQWSSEVKVLRWGWRGTYESDDLKSVDLQGFVTLSWVHEKNSEGFWAEGGIWLIYV